VRDEGLEPDALERWFSEDTDVRNNPAVGEKVRAFLKEHATKSVIVTEGTYPRASSVAGNLNFCLPLGKSILLIAIAETSA
jgi:hypothetical protein